MEQNLLFIHYINFILEFILKNLKIILKIITDLYGLESFVRLFNITCQSICATLLPITHCHSAEKSF